MNEEPQSSPGSHVLATTSEDGSVVGGAREIVIDPITRSW
jgi:hypothetical protein